MSQAESLITKARENIGFARYALAGEYADEAGRGAYMAAFHAALAFSVTRTGKSPKRTVVHEANSRGWRVASNVSAASRCRFSAGRMN
jgi:uncharacterized protein (UPF0332 family)